VLSQYEACRREFDESDRSSSEVLVFHGTPSSEALSLILESGFKVGGVDEGVAVVHGSVYGPGVYTAIGASTAQRYAQGTKAVILAKGLRGRSGIHTDFTADSTSVNTDWIVFRKGCQLLPQYVVHFDLSRVHHSASIPQWNPPPIAIPRSKVMRVSPPTHPPPPLIPPPLIPIPPMAHISNPYPPRCDKGAVLQWREASHAAVRQDMVEKILKLLRRRGALNCDAKLPIMSQRLEECLYRDAGSLEAYLDPQTLRARLQQLVLAMGSDNSTATSISVAGGFNSSGAAKTSPDKSDAQSQPGVASEAQKRSVSASWLGRDSDGGLRRTRDSKENNSGAGDCSSDGESVCGNDGSDCEGGREAKRARLTSESAPSSSLHCNSSPMTVPTGGESPGTTADVDAADAADDQEENDFMSYFLEPWRRSLSPLEQQKERKQKETQQKDSCVVGRRSTTVTTSRCSGRRSDGILVIDLT
jgi:hypothetical protein